MDYDFIVYTDGGYSQKANVGAFAYVICDGRCNEIKRGAWRAEHETNNRMELKAIIAALHHIPATNVSVLVRSDSQYALYTLNKSWSRRTNTDLFPIHDKIVAEKNLNVTYEWVKGHSGNKFNEICDQLCSEAAGVDLNAEYEFYKQLKKNKKQ